MRVRQHNTSAPMAVVIAGLCVAGSALGQKAVSANARHAGKESVAVNGKTATGDALLQARNFPAAMDQFEAVLARNPGEAKARRGEIAAATAWALEEEHQGHADQTMTILERAIRQLPDEPELLVSFGLEAVALGQLPIAEQALQAAQRLRPGDPNTTYALARLEIEQQHMPDAERDLKAYLASRPDDGSAYFGLGHVYAMEQRDDEARAAFQRSITLQPKQTESYYQVGQLDLQAHRDTEAKALFAQVLARNPHHAGALTGMGELALRLKDYPGAERLLAQAEQSDPTYATPHYFRGLALAKLGRKEEAEAELRRGDSRPHAMDAGGTGDVQAAVGSRKPPH